jgi:predicted O-linked N-acetylglucosamine transferase (SPINDLY family)
MAAAQLNLTETLALAKAHHGGSRLAEAEACYRQVLAAHADHADACNGLALLQWQQGRLDEALHYAEIATSREPTVWRYHQTCGLIASAMQRPNEAARAYERASALCPESPEAWCGLGQALHALQRVDEALVAYRRAQSLGTLSPQAANNFGLALTAARHHDEALEVLRSGLAQAPASGELWYNLGNALAAQAASPEAIAAFTQALKLQPGNIRAWLNLGNVLRARREFTAAIDCYGRALALDPENHDAYNNLGTALWAAGRSDEALQALNRAIALRPDSSTAHNNLGNVLKDSGRVEAAVAAFRRSVELAPQDSQAHSNLLYSLYFHPGYDEAAILREAKLWARAHAPGKRALVTDDLAPAREERTPRTRPVQSRQRTRERLHIGYVSPDFREHCQSLFTLPLLSHHDRSRFKIHCYAHLPSPDATSRRLASLADAWRPIYGSSDAEVEAMIRTDGIDVLVDLTMHMSNGRPLLFARGAAPVQVAWLAYPGTTGQPAIDFRLTDPWLDPPEFDDARYTEKSVRLPHTFWCYDPGEETPAVNELPAITAGHVTFGCLNNFCKVSDVCLQSWAQIMRAVPNSRLMLLAAPGMHRQRVLDVMGSQGIAAQRIEFVPYQPRAAYLATYQRIDLCLDTLPYNGHTTSLDAFWMGVPVVTRVGGTVVGRAGWSQLNNLQLSELAAFEDAEFVRKAVALAVDWDALSELRLNLRERMRSSPLMDGAAFAAAMESAYRQMCNVS